MMRRRGVLLMAALIGASLVLSAAPGFAERTPPGSFLRDIEQNGPGLAEQVRDVNYVGNRYANFYGLSASEVAQRFSHLQYRPLNQDHRVRVWFVGRGNRIISEMRTFKAGTPVFVTADGQLVLDGRCGNPLSQNLPRVVAQKPAPAPTVAANPEASAPTTMAQTAEMPAEVTLAQATPVEPEPVITQVLAQPTEVIISESVTPVVTATATEAVEAVPPVISGGGGGFSPLALLAIPAVALAAGGGGGNEVIPEPASLVALATGLTAFGGVMFRRRS